MARGFSWGLYVDNDGNGWAVKVDSDYLLDPDRGWVEVLDASTPQLPRGWKPRKVIGFDDQGNRRTAIAATTDAPIWALSVGTFTIEASDQTSQLVTITGRLEERQLHIR